MLISIAELWLGKEKIGRFSPNSIIKGIIEMIVFYSNSLQNGETIASQKIAKPVVGSSFLESKINVNSVL